MSEIIVAKCVSIAVIFAGSLVCGLLPAFRVFSAFPRFALSLLLSFGGGILIATSLVHILPEARELWPDIRFTPEMSLCMGIFLVYFVEEVAHCLVCHDVHAALHHGGHTNSSSGHENHNHGVHVHHEEPPNRCDEPAAVYLFAKEASSSCGRSGEYSNHSHSHHANNHNHSHSHHHHHNPQGGHDHHHHTSLEMEQQVKLFPGNNLTGSAAGAGAGDSDKIVPVISSSTKEDDKARLVATLRSIVGLVALSIHAGLEGLSIGLGRNSGDVWYLCAAISAHKLVIAFCLGMEVRAASTSPCTLVSTSSSSAFKFRYVLSFALMTPLGIAVGTIITEIVGSGAAEGGGTTQSTLVAVLQTLAGGTLLYVAFFEVVLRERARFSGKGLAQLLFVVMGFTVMTLMEIYVGNHDHSNGGGHHDGHDHSHSEHGSDHHSHENTTGIGVTPAALVRAAISAIPVNGGEVDNLIV